MNKSTTQIWRTQGRSKRNHGNRGNHERHVFTKPNKTNDKKNILTSSEIKNNCETLTVSKCLRKWDGDEYALIVGIQSLIENIHLSENILNILKEIKRQDRWPSHVSQSKKMQYNPLHKANFITSKCDHQILEQLYKLLHKVGYDILQKNVHDETAFQSLCNNNQITSEEKTFRYFHLANITPIQINKIAISTFNKIGNNNLALQDYFRYILCVDYKTVLVVIAGLLVTKKSSTSCGKLDLFIFSYIDFIIETFDGADNNFHNVKVLDNSLKKFFHEHKYELPSKEELLSEFWENVIDHAFNGSNHNIQLNMENLGIIIGGFANRGFLIDKYQLFIKECIDSSIDIFNIVTIETRHKMAIRALNHALKFTPEIKQLFELIPTNNGFIKFTIKTILDKENV